MSSETIWPGTKSTLPSTSESPRDGELYYGVSSNKKRRGPNQLPEQIRHYPEARANMQVMGLQMINISSCARVGPVFCEFEICTWRQDPLNSKLIRRACTVARVGKADRCSIL